MQYLSVTLNKFIFYLQGIIFSPSKTFKTIASDKKSKQFIKIFFVVLVLEGLLDSFIPNTQVLTHPTRTSLILKNFLDNFHMYSFAVVPVFWLISTYIMHLIVKAHAKYGHFGQLLVSQGFINVFIGLPTLIIYFIALYMPQVKILQQLVLIYSVYLSVIAINSIYGVSRKRALIATLGTILFLILTSVVATFIFLAVKLSTG